MAQSTEGARLGRPSSFPDNTSNSVYSQVGTRLRAPATTGWHTFGVDPIEHRRGSAVGTLRALARWGLLGAVIAAVLALHVMTAEHTPGQHAAVEAMSTESHSLFPLSGAESLAIDPIVGEEPAPAESAGDGLDLPGGSGELLLGCVLFLVVAGPALLLAMLRGRRTVEAATPFMSSVPADGGRPPVGPGVPRLALCVIRI